MVSFPKVGTRRFAMTDKPIVVATDLQARSDRAIDRGLMLGSETGKPVVVVHVLPSDRSEGEERA